MRKRIAFVGAIIGTTAGLGISRSVRTWRTWGIDPLEANKPLAGDDLVARSECRRDPRRSPSTRRLRPSGRGLSRWDMAEAAGTATTNSTCVARARRRSCRNTQTIAVGDIVPTSPTTGFVVREVEPGRALVLFSDTALVQSQAVAAADDFRAGEPQVPARPRRPRVHSLADASGIRRQLGLLARAPRRRPDSLDRAVPRPVRRSRAGVPSDRPDHGLRRLRHGAAPATRHPRSGGADGVAPALKQTEARPAELEAGSSLLERPSGRARARGGDRRHRT